MVYCHKCGCEISIEPTSDNVWFQCPGCGEFVIRNIGLYEGD